MTQAIELVAETRENVGKGSARAERQNKRIPAVIYGGKAAPLPISIEYKTIADHVNRRAFFTSICEIEIAGKKHNVLPRDIQFHPISDDALHIDFLRITKSTKVRVNIPLRFADQDKSPGLKRGGTLSVVSQEVEVLCSAMSIPDAFEVSLANHVLGQPVHLKDLTLPKGAELTAKDLNMTIASIAIPSALRSKAREEARSGSEEGAEATEEAAK